MKHGPASVVVAIPSDYRRYHKLEPRTRVKVLYDSLLLIIPPGCEHKLKEKEELIRRVLE